MDSGLKLNIAIKTLSWVYKHFSLFLILIYTLTLITKPNNQQSIKKTQNNNKTTQQHTITTHLFITIT